MSCWAKANKEARPRHQVRRGREGGREGGQAGTKDVSTNNESTYKRFSKVRESTIPGDSSVRSLKARLLKVTKDEIDQIVRVGSISFIIAHHH